MHVEREDGERADAGAQKEKIPHGVSPDAGSASEDAPFHGQNSIAKVKAAHQEKIRIISAARQERGISGRRAAGACRRGKAKRPGPYSPFRRLEMTSKFSRMSLNVASTPLPVGDCAPRPTLTGLFSRPGIVNQRRNFHSFPSSEK